MTQHEKIFTDGQLAAIDRNAPVTFGFVIDAIERLAELDRVASRDAIDAGAISVTSAFPLIELIGSAVIDTAIDHTASDAQQRHNGTGVYPVYPELPSTLLFDDGKRVRCSTNGKLYEKRGGAWHWVDETSYSERMRLFERKS
jgi:hypothetical protein